MNPQLFQFKLQNKGKFSCIGRSTTRKKVTRICNLDSDGITVVVQVIASVKSVTNEYQIAVYSFFPITENWIQK